MQATTSRTNHHVDTMKLSVLAAALVIVAIAGTLAFAIRSDSATTATSVSPVTTDMPAWHFAEINELPATAARPSDDAETRRFREINELPTSSARAPLSFEEQRFIEINQFPGDGDALVAPAMANGTRS